jgi:hypothetical protein
MNSALSFNTQPYELVPGAWQADVCRGHCTTRRTCTSVLCVTVCAVVPVLCCVVRYREKDIIGEMLVGRDEQGWIDLIAQSSGKTKRAVSSEMDRVDVARLVVSASGQTA